MCHADSSFELPRMSQSEFRSWMRDGLGSPADYALSRGGFTPKLPAIFSQMSQSDVSALLRDLGDSYLKSDGYKKGQDIMEKAKEFSRLSQEVGRLLEERSQESIRWLQEQQQNILRIYGLSIFKI